MNNIWTKNDLMFYELGIQYSDYPDVIWNRILEENEKIYSLLDIGAGPGAFTFKALEAGIYVQAVDTNKTHLNVLEEKCSEKKLLKLYPQDWIDADVEKSDISICAYSLTGSINSLSGLRKIIDKTKKTAYFISFKNIERADFQTSDLIYKLGLNPRKYKSDNSVFIKNLSKLGEHFEYREIEYDFGVPIFDEIPLDSYAEFIFSKTGIDDKTVLKKHIKNITILRNGMKWLPNPKKSFIIVWRKYIE